ncbi:MAG TPA: isocitrate/isopropylmalate dehydrogenase family protein [Candidatus Acidoferrum sp.]|nr:isocitrate/isopropylmalate dehydrogenase family protein [Candidatus Acidoferrum sp.]
MRDVIIIPGDGIGPEVAAAARLVLGASGVGINWIEKLAGAACIEKYHTPLPQETIDAVRSAGVALKGPVTTPVGSGFRSVNVALRQELELYVNLRPVRSIPGIPSRYEGIDLVIVRENMEDLYAGVEHMVGEDAAESIKIFTRGGCRRILRYAFEYAASHGRKKVTAVHKANIMKLTDGMFLAEARKMAAEYPALIYEDKIVDALCMELVTAPEKFDVLVLPNLYGDIVSDLAAGLVGGLGVAPGANLGDKTAIFEAVHGSAPTIAGKNVANPTSLILSGAMLLRHIGEERAARAVEEAVAAVAGGGKALTAEHGGKTGTRELAAAVAAKVKELI